MIYLIFAITLFFTTWLNAKFIRDASGKDQYWHIVQLYQQGWYYVAYAIVMFLFGRSLDFVWHNYLIPLVSWGFMYMLLYNSLLNAMRKINITHLGRYDFLTFTQTVIAFIIGLMIAVLHLIGII